MSLEQLKMKLEKKQEEEDGGGGAEKTAAKQRPRKKIFENLKFEEGVRALREEKEKLVRPHPRVKSIRRKTALPHYQTPFYKL